MKRVLLVDDNRTNRKLLGDLLRHVGHEVLEAATSEDALALVEGHAFDLVVLDVQLPGLDGLAATRLLRADPRHAGLPVLAVTALAMRGDEQRVRAAGCDGYLSKPVDYRHFLGEVQRLLEQGR